MVRRTPQKASLLVAGGIFSLLAVPALAEPPDKAWISGEARYNLRRAPGADYRAVDLVKSGDEVVLLEEANDWARVRTASGGEGWIDLAHLQREPPPFARVTRLEAELAEVQERLAKERQAAEQLRTERAGFEADTALGQKKNDQLRAENDALRAEARWRDWVTGGAIVLLGMLLGALIQRVAMRRASARLRF